MESGSTVMVSVGGDTKVTPDKSTPHSQQQQQQQRSRIAAEMLSIPTLYSINRCQSLSFVADLTPTPTRFLRAAGVDESSGGASGGATGGATNPFDEQFRRAAERNRINPPSHLLVNGAADSVCVHDEPLNTPTVLPPAGGGSLDTPALRVVPATYRHDTPRESFERDSLCHVTVKSEAGVSRSPPCIVINGRAPAKLSSPDCQLSHHQYEDCTLPVDTDDSLPLDMRSPVLLAAAAAAAAAASAPVSGDISSTPPPLKDSEVQQLPKCINRTVIQKEPIGEPVYVSAAMSPSSLPPRAISSPLPPSSVLTSSMPAVSNGAFTYLSRADPGADRLRRLSLSCAGHVTLAPVSSAAAAAWLEAPSLPQRTCLNAAGRSYARLSDADGGETPGSGVRLANHSPSREPPLLLQADIVDTTNVEYIIPRSISSAQAAAVEHTGSNTSSSISASTSVITTDSRPVVTASNSAAHKSSSRKRPASISAPTYTADAVIDPVSPVSELERAEMERKARNRAASNRWRAKKKRSECHMELLLRQLRDAVETLRADNQQLRRQLAACRCSSRPLPAPLPPPPLPPLLPVTPDSLIKSGEFASVRMPSDSVIATSITSGAHHMLNTSTALTTHEDVWVSSHERLSR